MAIYGHDDIATLDPGLVRGLSFEYLRYEHALPAFEAESFGSCLIDILYGNP